METIRRPIRSIIVDDEKRCVDMLRLDLEKYCPEVEILAGFTSPKEALLEIKKTKPDLLFLDVEMPWINGFELLELLGEPFFEVIFTTAYDRFAVKAFQFSAIDYLLKPVNPEDLKKAVNKMREKADRPLTQAHVDYLIKNIHAQESRYERLVLPSSNGYEFVPLSEIVFIQADGNYTTVTLQSGKQLLVSRSLKDLHSMIEDDSSFFRIHQSYLINLVHVQHYSRSDGGYVTMSNGKQLSVARAKKEAFLNRIKHGIN